MSLSALALPARRERLSGCRRLSETGHGSTRDASDASSLGISPGRGPPPSAGAASFVQRRPRPPDTPPDPFNKRHHGHTFSSLQAVTRGARASPGARHPAPVSRLPLSSLRPSTDVGATDKGTPAAMRVRKARSLGRLSPRSSGYRRSSSRVLSESGRQRPWPFFPSDF